MEIVKGIHQIDRVRGANSYLVIDKNKLMVIDTGLPGNAKRIIRYVKTLGRNPADIKYIILTHTHIDHAGSAADLKKLSGAKIVMHTEDARDFILGKHSFTAIKGHRGPFIKWTTNLIRYPKGNPDITVTDSLAIDDFIIVPTPGHTKGSISVYMPGKAIFAGDALSVDSGGNPRPIFRFNLDTAKSRASIKIIASMDFEALFPGHHIPIVAGASQKVREMAAHLD